MPASRCPAGHDDHPLLAQQRLDRQAAQVDRQPQVADVHRPVVDDVGLVDPVGPQHLDRDLGMEPGELAHGRGDDQAGHEPDREHPLARADVRDPPPGRVGGRQQRPAVLEQRLPGRGEPGRPLVPLEQLHLQLLLERADLPRQHRLGDMQRLRGAPEVQLLGHRHEIAHLAQIQVHGTPASSGPPGSNASTLRLLTASAGALTIRL